MKHITLFLAFTLTALAQQPARVLKPFTPPPVSTFVPNPIVASNIGCAKDLAKASKLEGLEQHKALFELTRYGCVRLAPGGYTAVTLEVQMLDKVAFQRVRLISLNDYESVNSTIEGWIPVSDLHLRDAVLQAMMQHLDAATRDVLMQQLRKDGGR
jgi:hypothetical protein